MQTYRLENGLNVILQEDHSAPVVAVQAWVNVGSADELPDEAGLAHVHEHMLFKGTERRGVGEIAAEVEGAGGLINAWTSYDQTVYHIVMASRFADRAVDILADALQGSAFDGSELERELQVIQEEISRGEDLPSRVLSQNLFSTAFRAHPYGKPIIGTRESVDSFTRDHVLRFYRRWYRPDNITFVVVGDFAPEAMRAQIESLLGRFPASGTERAARPEEPAQSELRVSVETRDILEGHFALGFHVPGLNHDDIPALDLLSVLLGQGESSILHREIKREKALVTSIYSYVYTPREPGLMMIAGSFRGDDGGAVDPRAVLTAVLDELFATQHAYVGANDLRRVKTMLESEAIYEAETVQGRANRFGYFHVVAEDLAFEERFMALARAVTPERLNEVARRYLRPENLTVALVLPEARGDAPSEAEIKALVEAAQARANEAARSHLDEPDAHGVITHTFANGLRLVVQEDHSVGLAAVRAVFPGGLRFETPLNNGVNNFVSELLTAGTSTRSAQEIAETIEAMAGALSGFSGRNSIGLQLDVLSADIEPALALLAECVTDSVFPETEVARIRNEILAEISAQEDDLASTAFRQMARTLFAGHPFELNPLGTPETVGAFTRDDLLAFYRKHLKPSGMILSVVGDVSAFAMVQVVERLLGGGPGEAAPAIEVPEAVAPATFERVVTLRERAQTHLATGYVTVSLRHEDRWPLELLAAILSGQGGRLFLQLRDKQSLAYSVGAYNMFGLDAGYFATYIATSPARADEASESMLRELERVREELVGEDELERAKTYLVGQREIGFQRVGNRAAYLAFDEAYGLGHGDHWRHAERLLATTREDVRRVARQYLDPARCVLSVVCPEKTPET